MNIADSDQLIIWCGDSWSYGHGLGTNKKSLRFPTLVSKNLNANCLNFSQSGSSIGHLVYKLNQIQRVQNKNKNILVLFGLTVPYRLCIRKEFGKKLTVGVNDFDLCSYRTWAKDIFNNHHIMDETCIKLSWIANQCRLANIKYKFYNILGNYYDFEKSKFSQYLDHSDWIVDPVWSTYSEIFDVEKFNFGKMSTLEKTTHGKNIIKKYIIPNDSHPNHLGHIKISQRLTSAVSSLL
jgi:hypothetical protein